VPLIEQPQAGGAKPTVQDLTYEDVRQSFLIRLHGEQSQLLVLSDSLGSAEVAPASAFGDLEGFAHRLRGAAAVFDFPELRDAAKVLEIAASAALVEQAPLNEPRVRTAIGSLVTRLSWLTGGTSPADAAVLLAPAN